MRDIALIAIYLALSLSIAGCFPEDEKEKDGDCSTSMANTVKAYGPAEEWTSYDADGYHSRSWWYWSIGFERSFTWGSNIDGCDWSDYNFAPIA